MEFNNDARATRLLITMWLSKIGIKLDELSHYSNSYLQLFIYINVLELV